MTLTMIRNFRGFPNAAEQRVARGAAPAGPARKGPTGGWVERRAGGGGAPRQDPLLLRASRTGNSGPGLTVGSRIAPPGTAVTSSDRARGMRLGLLALAWAVVAGCRSGPDVAVVGSYFP